MCVCVVYVRLHKYMYILYSDTTCTYSSSSSCSSLMMSRMNSSVSGAGPCGSGRYSRTRS